MLRHEGRQDLFKPKIANESLHEVSNNNNGVRLVNLATCKYLLVKSTTFPHDNIRQIT
jgi:hypothetical protein